jgi:hypothetical protein
MSLDGTYLEQLETSISSHHIKADINTLLHLHETSQQYASKNNGITSGLIAASVVLSLFILYYFTQAYIWNMVKKCVVSRVDTVNDVQQSLTDILTPSQPITSSGEVEELSETIPQAKFSAYSMQSV